MIIIPIENQKIIGGMIEIMIIRIKKKMIIGNIVAGIMI